MIFFIFDLSLGVEKSAFLGELIWEKPRRKALRIQCRKDASQRNCATNVTNL